MKIKIRAYTRAKRRTLKIKDIKKWETYSGPTPFMTDKYNKTYVTYITNKTKPKAKIINFFIN
jgi:hypothetical protein